MGKGSGRGIVEVTTTVSEMISTGPGNTIGAGVGVIVGVGVGEGVEVGRGVRVGTTVGVHVGGIAIAVGVVVGGVVATVEGVTVTSATRGASSAHARAPRTIKTNNPEKISHSKIRTQRDIVLQRLLPQFWGVQGPQPRQLLYHAPGETENRTCMVTVQRYFACHHEEWLKPGFCQCAYCDAKLSSWIGWRSAATSQIVL